MDSLRGISIFLVGLMGSGKSTVGQILGDRLQYRFYDSDVLVERVAGCPITDIFAQQGEAAFRDLESQVLAQLAAQTRSVIATGGGIVLRPQNWSYLHHGLVVWLDAPVALLVERLETDTTRPLLQNADLQATLTRLAQERQRYYAQADIRLTLTPDQTPETIVETLLAEIPRHLKTPPAPPNLEQN